MGVALYTIILEKIPERSMVQYYRWIKENKQWETLETLKEWVSQEAEFKPRPLKPLVMKE